MARYGASAVRCFTMGCDGMGYRLRRSQVEVYCPICEAKRRKAALKQRNESEVHEKKYRKLNYTERQALKRVTIVYDPEGELDPGIDIDATYFNQMRKLLPAGMIYEYDGKRVTL